MGDAFLSNHCSFCFNFWSSWGKTPEMNRRDFFLGCSQIALLSATSLHSGGAGSSSKWRTEFEWEEATIRQLRTAMEKRRESAVSLAKAYLKRIRDVDQNGPKLNSVIEINPDAIAIARELDRERKNKGARGPLHGIPVLIKDNIDTHDRMMTTAGSLALVGSIPSRDAFLVRRLREAGAVILGKTNLSEWANFRSNHSTSGWSGRGGLTRNPYALDRNPSGSSAGSGAAVSGNMCAVAVGTETDGSIVSPSSACGIVGIKPTVGLVSRSGIIPISQSQDTAGPMARTVEDAAILLGALAGVDSLDTVTNASTGRAQTDYARFLDPNGLKGARIGVARDIFHLPKAEAEKLIESMISELKRLGAIVIDPANARAEEKIGNAEYQVMLYEFKDGLNKYLANLGPEIKTRTLKDLIEFNEQNREREMPYFGQEIFQQAQEKGPLTDQGYLDALEKCRRLSRKQGIDSVMEKHQLDALIAPTAGPAHRTDLVYGNRDTGGSSSAAAVAGYPSITVPVGYVAGLPVGLSFFGKAYTEPTLIKLAYGFEQGTKARRKPEFLGTLAES
jgi:amidase